MVSYILVIIRYHNVFFQKYRFILERINISSFPLTNVTIKSKAYIISSFCIHAFFTQSFFILSTALLV